MDFFTFFFFILLSFIVILFFEWVGKFGVVGKKNFPLQRDTHQYWQKFRTLYEKKAQNATDEGCCVCCVLFYGSVSVLFRLCAWTVVFPRVCNKCNSKKRRKFLIKIIKFDKKKRRKNCYENSFSFAIRDSIENGLKFCEWKMTIEKFSLF